MTDWKLRLVGLSCVYTARGEAAFALQFDADPAPCTVLAVDATHVLLRHDDRGEILALPLAHCAFFGVPASAVEVEIAAAAAAARGPVYRGTLRDHRRTEVVVVHALEVRDAVCAFDVTLAHGGGRHRGRGSFTHGDLPQTSGPVVADTGLGFELAVHELELTRAERVYLAGVVRVRGGEVKVGGRLVRGG